MRGQLRVFLLPDLIPVNSLQDSTVAVIDVLRATTTIATALASGATRVIPCLDIETAKELAQIRLGSVLGGERQGLKIPGFDLGNSPAEYSPSAVRGKAVIMTTTNGTRALLRCQPARTIYLASFVNLSCICGVLATADDLAIVCAGTNQEITQEDVWLAGAITERLVALKRNTLDLNDQAQLARAAWKFLMPGTVQSAVLVEALRGSLGGRNLIEIGQDSDIEWAADIDSRPVVPRFDPVAGYIQTG